MSAIQFITSDTQAKAFLASENMLQNLIPQPPLDHVCAIWANAASYCAASYDCGHVDPADNGYTVLIIPRDLVPLETAKEILLEFRQAGRLDPDGITRDEVFEREPAYN